MSCSPRPSHAPALSWGCRAPRCPASSASASRPSRASLRGERPLPPGSKEGELAALLVRVYRSLDALVGNDDGKRAAWMGSYNRALGGVPRDLVQTAEGLVGTLNYLDGLRAPA